MVTSPAASVCNTSVLPSDFTTVPVSRSPFFNVTWSANKADDNPRNAHQGELTYPSLRNTTYLQDCRAFENENTLGARNSDGTEIGTQRQRGGNYGRKKLPTMLFTWHPQTATQKRLTPVSFWFQSSCSDRSRRRRLFLHAVFKAANALGQSFAEFGQLLRAEQQQSNRCYQEPMPR